MVKKRKLKNENFFIRFWNGELSLPMSYWGVGVGIGILFGFIIVAFVIAARCIITSDSDRIFFGTSRKQDSIKRKLFLELKSEQYLCVLRLSTTVRLLCLDIFLMSSEPICPRPPVTRMLMTIHPP